MSVKPLDADAVLGLVADAVAAPSMHNTQPWRFRFRSDSRTFEVRADLLRALDSSDPDNRALHLSCGAALFNLRVAAVQAGWHPLVRLLPDSGADPEAPLLATLGLAEPVRPEDRDLVALYPAIMRRRSSRYPFEEREIPDWIWSALADAARREGALLTPPTTWHTDAVLDLVGDAEGRDARDPARLAELDRWTRPGDDGLDPPFADEGVPAYAFGPRKRSGHAPVRDFAGRRPVTGRGSADFEQRPQLALLGTEGDRPPDWLAAGQAMQRVLLLATVSGLATSLSSQALESAELRRLVRDPESPMGCVQMVMRLGYGPAGPVTPRRQARDVLDFV